MLRYAVNDTNTFFSIFRSYMADTNLRFKNAVTADFTSKVNQVTGSNYDWFFDEWVYKPNHPKYENTYNITQLDSVNWKVQFNAKQVQPNPVFFKMPIVLKIVLVGPDSTLRVMNDVNNQLYDSLST
jgi:aminopeptidase N